MATGSRTPWVRQQFFDDNGNPLSGGLIDTYIAGSTTPINTYTDITLTTTHTNPIVLNTRGETTIFLDPTVAYKFVLRNPLPDGSEIWTQDNITALGGNSLLTDLGVIRSKVVGSATLPVPLATNVVIPYDTADYEVNLTGFDGTANKWVCPLNGVYDLNAAVDFTIQSTLAAPSASCEIFFLVNGVTSKNSKKWAFTTDTSGGQKTLETSGTLQLTKNDEVKVVFISATQGSGTSIDLILGAAFWDIISLSGVKGNTGDQGPAGQGVPVGGTANQVLAKIDATDYNTQWVNDTSSPSQGVSGIINVANGSGGWIGMDGNPPLNVTFFYDNSIGVLSFTGASLFTTTNLEATNNIYISNDLGALDFRDNSKNHMAGISIDKDTVGLGLHDLTISGQNRLYINSATYINTIDPGTDTNKVMLVQDANTNKVEKRPLPTSGGSPSQGAQNVFNVANGSGGWTALNSVSLPIFFRYDSTDGLIKNTGAPIYTDGAISSDNYVINNNTGQIIFAETGTSISTTEMGRLQVSKDSLGSGLHRLAVEGFKQLYLGLVDFHVAGEIKFPALVDPSTDTNKTMLVVDSTSGVVQKRPIPSSLDNTKLAILNNLSDLNSVSTARTNLGLGTAAILDVGTSATNIVQLDALAKLPAVDGSQLTNISATDSTKLAILNNLSDLNNSATARTNLGLGTAAVLNTGTGANNIVQLDGTSKLPAVDGSQLTNLPSGGSPSQGAQYDFNVANGSGGWIPLSTANGPRFYKDTTTSELVYEHHIVASYFNATLGIDIKKDNGQLRWKDNAGTTTHAMINSIPDNNGPGLHALIISLCDEVLIQAKAYINGDFRAVGDVQFTSLIDSGTNTNKEMVVWDNTTAKLERRPIPTGAGGSDTKVLVQGQMDTTQSFSTSAERIDYVDSTLDVNNEWDNTTHRFTCGASGAGVYQFTNTIFVNNGAGWNQIFCKKNGVIQRVTGSEFNANWDAPMGTTNIDLVVGDYVEFWLDSSQAFSMSSQWYALNNFQITKISAVAPAAGVDVNAVHTNIANEITPLTLKANPHDDDVLIIEDSEDSNNKKSIKIGDLPNYRASNLLTASTLTIDVGLYTQFSLRNISDTTVTIAPPTNGGVSLTSSHDGQKLTIRLRDNGTSRTLVWNAIFRAIGVTLPTSTTALKTIYVGCIYNGSSAKWDVVAVAEEA